MRKLVFLGLIAAGLAASVTPAAAQYAQATREAAPAAAVQVDSVLLPNNGGLQLAAGQRVTLSMDAAGTLALVSVEPLGFNAVAPGAGGAASVASTAQPGTIAYSLQGPVLKIENGLATAFNYSAQASLDIGGQLVNQTVKTCTVLPGRVAFEMWSATVKVPTVVLGAPVVTTAAVGCS